MKKKYFGGKTTFLLKIKEINWIFAKDAVI